MGGAGCYSGELIIKKRRLYQLRNKLKDCRWEGRQRRRVLAGKFLGMGFHVSLLPWTVFLPFLKRKNGFRRAFKALKVNDTAMGIRTALRRGISYNRGYFLRGLRRLKTPFHFYVRCNTNNMTSD